jgi:hypothetical protein
MALLVTAAAIIWCISAVAAAREMRANAASATVIGNCLGAAAVWALIIAQLSLWIALLLVGVAYIHVVVDAARNIRALKLKHGGPARLPRVAHPLD